jgi:hypothetical protein
MYRSILIPAVNTGQLAFRQHMSAQGGKPLALPGNVTTVVTRLPAPHKA